MQLSELSAISPIDGRYRKTVVQLSGFFSEFALIRYRVRVEVEYFIRLIEFLELHNFTEAEKLDLRNIYKGFSIQDAEEIKTIERTTNHDVKAVEYFIKKKFENTPWENFAEWVHFGLTSQDINNTAIPLSIRESLHFFVYPKLKELIEAISDMAYLSRNKAMLARTHGQPASPTYLGKELLVFSERLKAQMTLLKQVPMSAKFGGATGNFNAHYAAFPQKDWQQFAIRFLKDELWLDRSYPTTQIDHYDNLAALLDGFKRINTILIDFCRDMWQYISMEYFVQQVVANEVGSSAMPHKVNPIDFENAEGNLGLANALFEHLSAKLPISRLQRDLTDSTVLRNIGVPFSHTFLAFTSILKGLGKLKINDQALLNDLDKNWAVVAEGIQTIMRREQIANPYEMLKALTRGKQQITKADFEAFIHGLEVSDSVKQELLSLSPVTYTGHNPF